MEVWEQSDSKVAASCNKGLQTAQTTPAPRRGLDSVLQVDRIELSAEALDRMSRMTRPAASAVRIESGPDGLGHTPPPPPRAEQKCPAPVAAESSNRIMNMALGLLATQRRHVSELIGSVPQSADSATSVPAPHQNLRSQTPPEHCVRYRGNYRRAETPLRRCPLCRPAPTTRRRWIAGTG